MPMMPAKSLADKLRQRWSVAASGSPKQLPPRPAAARKKQQSAGKRARAQSSKPSSRKKLKESLQPGEDAQFGDTADTDVGLAEESEARHLARHGKTKASLRCARCKQLCVQTSSCLFSLVVTLLEDVEARDLLRECAKVHSPSRSMERHCQLEAQVLGASQANSLATRKALPQGRGLGVGLRLLLAPHACVVAAAARTQTAVPWQGCYAVRFRQRIPCDDVIQGWAAGCPRNGAPSRYALCCLAHVTL